MSEVTYYIKIFIAIFVLVNPIEGIPLFLSKTGGLAFDQKIKIARKASTTVFIVLLISLYVGRYLLELFGIGIPAFTLAGGVIIFLISLDMVLGKSSMADKSVAPEPADAAADIAIVPLAIPLLAGPGAISSVIVYGSKSNGLTGDLILTGIVLLVGLATAFSLNAAARMEKVLNATAINVMTKVSGLFVAAIAVQLVFSGLKEMIPSL